MGALDQVEGPLSKAVVKTQLKRSERTLRGTISVAVTNMDMLVTQQMTQAQYHKAGPLVEELLTQVREENRGIVSKFEATILSQELASEEDTTLLRTTEEFMAQMLPEVSSILTKMVENIPNRSSRRTRSSRRSRRDPIRSRRQSCTSTAGEESC